MYINININFNMGIQFLYCKFNSNHIVIRFKILHFASVISVQIDKKNMISDYYNLLYIQRAQFS